MKITNKTDLPEPIVEAIKANEWSRGAADISVTELISPLQITALRVGFHDVIEEDAADRIFALMGQIGHGLLERAGYSVFPEERMLMNVGPWTLSGRMDSLWLEDQGDDAWGIDDYKFTSGYVAKDAAHPAEGSRLLEWFLQANLYRMLAVYNGFTVNKLRLILLLRDWSILKAKREADFPQKQVMVINVPLQDVDQLRDWTRRRIDAHMEAQQGLDQFGPSHIPECTPLERWHKPDSFAIIKKGRKSAIRVLSTMVEADEYLRTKNLDPKVHTVEKRIGGDVRCETYCDVAPFCHQRLSAEAKS